MLISLDELSVSQLKEMKKILKEEQKK